ncbi:TauD/TfdA family dioxygenase [Pseudomonas sp. PMCC200344]|uniref:TauD/TfdA family dioxygenase n=1 Tax=Pseudomonas sp. PMCC200344 TaxID=3042028 RepID=UPI0024B393BD|nr:TauD/TfdA family dioxygenase [Pseudomonas sp. PMCC200344]
MTTSKKFDFFDTQGISNFLNENGYCVIKPQDNSLEAFRDVAGKFGQIQFHTKSDEHGVVGGGEPINKDWQNFKDDYHGELSSDFFPHTDGSFLNGITYVDGVAKKITPPKFVILQCVSKPEFGGDNFLVDGQKIYNDLLANQADILKTLMTSGSVTYCRDDLLSMDCSVFEKINDSKLRIRYRYDSTAFLPEWASAAFKYIQNQYSTNEDYIINVSLEPGDILVMDNLRVLHARHKFIDGSKKRKVRRLWIADDSSVIFENILNQSPVRRAMSPFQKYNIAQQGNAEHLLIEYTCGIHYQPSKSLSKAQRVLDMIVE